MAITNKQLAELLATVTVGADHRETLDAAYQTAFGRNVDDEGFEYWSDRLDNGLDAETELLEALLDGADAYVENADYPANVAVNAADKTTIVNKLEVAEAIQANTAVTAEEAASILATVTTDASKTTALDDVAAIVSGETFVLTASDDEEVINGTEKSDLFDASATNSLQDGDIILDNYSTDNDILNATVTTDDVNARIQNVETINMTGQYLTTGLDLQNVTGTTTLNLNTKLSNGTASVTNANTLNAEKIVAGDKIKNLNVDSSAVGTRDTVYVDANAATSVVITGDNGGVDTYDVTVADGASVEVKTATTNDTVTINTAGGDLTYKGTSSVEDLIINAVAATIVTVDNGLGDDTVINSDFDVVLKGASALFTAKGITTTGTGTTTLQVAAITDTNMLNEAIVDVVELTTAMTDGHTLTVNGDSTVNLTGNITGASDEVANIDIDNVDGDMDDGAGTLLLNVSESQSGVITIGSADATSSDAGDTTSSNAGTVIVTATPDEDDDTANGAEITINALDLDANGSDADTLVVQGSNNLTINTITNVADGVISAQDMTGELTIVEIENDYDVLTLGSGNDVIGDTTTDAEAGIAGAGTIYGNGGDDTIYVAAASTVYGGAGNDTIKDLAGGAGVAMTIDGGAGDDTIAAGKAINKITTGTGADTVILASADSVGNTTDNTTITDFTKGTDKLVLTGVSAAAVDITDLTVASGVYTIDTNFKLKLTDNTATDMSDSIQLGTEAANFVAKTAVATVAGDLDDYIVGDGSGGATITLGGGNDTFVVDATNTSDTIADFVIGEDKIVLTGAGTTGDIDLSAAQTNTSGAFDLGSTSGDYEFTLTDITATDLSNIVQLGNAKAAFTVATGEDVVGGDFADYINGAAGGDSIITGGKGADIIDLHATQTAGSTAKVNAGDSLTTAWDEVSNFNAVGDATASTLDLASTNIATVVTSTQVGDITGVTIVDGVITKWAGIDATTIDADQLTDAIAFLSENVIGATDTVAFEYKSDEDGDGAYTTAGETSTFVFQNGETETLVELIGVTDVEALATSAAADTILLG